MRVGIITLTGSDNYGNVLQNYALQEMLKELGCEVETIQNTTSFGCYNPEREYINKLTLKYIRQYVKDQLNYRYNIKNSGKGLVMTINYCRKKAGLIYKQKKIRKKVFNDFIEHYICWGPDKIDINKPWTREQCDRYDFFVSGSDQVWNPTYPSTSEINFLQFAPVYKRISYAPSFGIQQIPTALRQDYTKWIGEIPFLSVREESGRKLIQELTGREAKLVCDPTMAIAVEVWYELESKPLKIPDGKYILSYFLGDRTKEYDSYIEKIAQKYQMEIISLFDILDMNGYVVSPQEFIYLIHHASLVCTDSFHGTVFSIIMHTDFVSFSRIESGKSMNSRLESLLTIFNLSERCYGKILDEDIFCTDFKNVNGKLTELRQTAMEFLKNAIRSNRDMYHTQDLMSTIYASKDKCSGCTSCAASCPMQCIQMMSDEEGFVYPIVDEIRCIQCGKCKRVCPVIAAENGQDFTNEERISDRYIVAHTKREDIRRESSSGGIFTECSQFVIDRGGVAFGAGFTADFEVAHKKVDDIRGLADLRGSKYVQSNMNTIYFEVKKELGLGRQIYFSGTPCQIAGLYTYLGNKRPDNLITQDVICHGVPSPMVWKKYIDTFQNVENISFRNKKYGWHYFSMFIRHQSKYYVKRLDEDFYLRLFLDNTILRPSCYNCPMKKNKSCADITLADCWNLDTITEKVKDNDKGMSLVILRTDKGDRLWKQIVKRKKVFSIDVNSERALGSQAVLGVSAPCNPKRAMFFKALKMVSFDELMLLWYRDSAICKVRKKEIYLKTKIRFYQKNVKTWFE